MNGFLLRMLTVALLTVVTAFQMPGLFVDTLGALLVAALAIGLLNSCLRPLFAGRGWPLNWLWLAVAALLLNLAVPLLIMKILPGLRVDNMAQAVTVWLVLTACSTALTRLVQDR